MSGIVAILNLDGAPVDRTLLARMTEFMTFRGPDAQEFWADHNVGFGHTLLQTTEGSEHQPFTLDGRTWIVADARVDAQPDLIAKLSVRGEHVGTGATDVELLWRAYRAWGEQCVDYLLGDFAFAVWDGPRQRLFFARDHLGVKPFFYAHVGQTVILSNTLDCIRQHPAVSDKLNDLAIADFLLFALNQDPATTSFAEIQRLPPAHRATWSTSGLQINRYWTLPIDEPVYFRRAADYVDRFKELLDTALNDRLRTNKVGVFMSGGLDSTTLAATAHQVLRKRFADFELQAFTADFGGKNGMRYYRDETRYYAGLVGEALGFPIHYRDGQKDVWDPEWYRTAVHTPEPVMNPMNLIADRNFFRQVSAHARVLFWGEGPDNALVYEWRPYLAFLARQRRFGRLVFDLFSQVVRNHRIPWRLFIPSLGNRDDVQWRAQWEPSYPEWLDPGFESRFDLRRRWQQEQVATPSIHPVRPVAYKSFGSTAWQRLFETLDSAYIGAAFDVRHPFVDLRLLRFFLAVPVLPWCREKYLLRTAMKGILPEPVRLRRKTFLTGDPVLDRLRMAGLPPFDPAPQLSDFVCPNRLPRVSAGRTVDVRTNFRARSLNYWLTNLQTIGVHEQKGKGEQAA